jgi:hypothetical protein
MRLFTYTIPVDDGAAPNPFGGYCTLTICKPAIRRVAKEGDWVAGFGSKNSPSGDLSGKLVYAMEVTQVLSMEEYDIFAPSQWPFKIPDINSMNLSSRLGDCIYDFSVAPPKQRDGVHGVGNMVTDLSGQNALLSSRYYYFGRNAITIPEHLYPILHQTQGHKSSANDKYVNEFVNWIVSLKLVPGQLYGWPDFIVSWSSELNCGCMKRQCDAESDREMME